MKERPIIFSGKMVRAILDGRKTQTRRVLRDQELPMHCRHCDGRIYEHKGYPTGHMLVECPYGEAGDHLWVRETARGRCYGGKKGKKPNWIELLYRADEAMVQFKRADLGPYKLTGHWTPSIFMPRWASRIELTILVVRVEQLRDIKWRDVRAEGIDLSDMTSRGRNRDIDAGHRFAKLWDSLNAKRGYGWAANPWVWVIEFERVSE